MEVIQKKIFYKVNAEYSNYTLSYQNTSWFFKSENECKIYNLHLDEFCVNKVKNNILRNCGIIFFCFSCFVFVDMFISGNTIDNFLFWFIPCVFCWVFYFLTIRNVIQIPTDFGFIEFLDRKDDELLQMLRQFEVDNEQFSSYENKEELFGDKLFRLISESEDLDFNEKERIDYISEKLEGCKCPICNKRNEVHILKTYDVYNYIIFTFKESDYLIGCKKCLKNDIKKKNVISFFLGIWSIPLGVIETPIVIIINTVKRALLSENKKSKDYIKFIKKEIKKKNK